MSVPVRTTPEADAQISEIDDWWRTNRLSSRDRFLDELTAALDVIAHTPNIGRTYRRAPVPNVRRVLLKNTRYHVYYVPRANDVTVLAVWHGRRGVGPPLRGS